MSLFFLNPFCTLCFTPFLGIGVGYLASWFDKPLREESSLIKGTIAGSISGIGVIIGQILAAIISGIFVTNWEDWPQLMAQLSSLLQGMEMAQFAVVDSNQYWQMIIIGTSLCSMINLALIVGLGAVGSMIWFQRHSKNSLSVV
jgi:MFS family permease